MRTALLAALFIVAGIGLTPGPSTAADDDAYRNGYANRMIKQDEPMTVGDPDEPDTRTPYFLYLPSSNLLFGRWIVSIQLPLGWRATPPLVQSSTQPRHQASQR